MIIFDTNFVVALLSKRFCFAVAVAVAVVVVVVVVGEFMFFIRLLFLL